MNILFIEDDPDLQASGVLQLVAKGHRVCPTYDLVESRKILTDETKHIDLIISDHQLPDGLGIEFIIEMRNQFPDCQAAIVSGCLNSDDILILERHNIPYFKKPLLYTKVIEEMRKKPALGAPVYVEPEPEPEPEATPEPEPRQKKKLFGWRIQF